MLILIETIDSKRVCTYSCDFIMYMMLLSSICVIAFCRACTIDGLKIKIGDHVSINNGEDNDDGITYVAKITRLFDSGKYICQVAIG